MKRRSRPRVPLIQSALAFRAVLLVVTILSISGFIRFTQIVLEMQKHFASGGEHPWDYWADACFGIALIALAMFFLTCTEQPTKRMLQKRVKSESIWRKARRRHSESGELPTRAKRTRRHSGYNNGK